MLQVNRKLNWLLPVLLFAGLAIGWLCACDQLKVNQHISSQNISKPLPARLTLTAKKNRQALLALYTPTDSFPLFISTKAGEWEGPESPNFKWQGQEIPLPLCSLFDSLIHYNKQAETSGLFATCKFRVDSTTVALLTRVPGDYWSGKIYLFLLDINRYTITSSLLVAEAWANAGNSFYIESQLNKSGNHYFRVNISQRECFPVDENFEKFTCTDSIKTALVRNQKVKIITKKKLFR